MFSCDLGSFTQHSKFESYENKTERWQFICPSNIVTARKRQIGIKYYVLFDDC